MKSAGQGDEMNQPKEEDVYQLIGNAFDEVIEKEGQRKVGVASIMESDGSKEDKVAIKLRKFKEGDDSKEDKVAVKLRRIMEKRGIQTIGNVSQEEIPRNQKQSEVGVLANNKCDEPSKGNVASELTTDLGRLDSQQTGSISQQDKDEKLNHSKRRTDTDKTALKERRSLRKSSISAHDNTESAKSPSPKSIDNNMNKASIEPGAFAVSSDIKNLKNKKPRRSSYLSAPTKEQNKLLHGISASKNITQTSPLNTHLIDNSLASAKPGAFAASLGTADKVKCKQEQDDKSKTPSEEMKCSLSNENMDARAVSKETLEVSGKNLYFSDLVDENEGDETSSPNEASKSKESLAISDSNLPVAYLVDEIEPVFINENQLDVAGRGDDMLPLPVGAVEAVEAKLVLPWYKQKKILALIFFVFTIFAIVVGVLLSLRKSDVEAVVTPLPSLSPSVSILPTSIPSLGPTGFYELQRLSLRNFHKNHNGKHWLNSSGWDDKNDDSDVCKWFGITCGEQFQDVTKISLSNNNLTGDLNVAELTVLQTLEDIDLSLNALGGNMTIISDHLASISSLDIIDFRLTHMHGNVSETFCKIHGSAGNSIKELDGVFIDCQIECSCCKAREAYCECVDMVGFVDVYDDGCDWYSEFEEEGCPRYGWVNGSGIFSNITANDACCQCNGGEPQSLLAPSGSPSQSPSALYAKTTQRDALTNFYHDSFGDDWTLNRMWLSDDTVCYWYGLSCTSSHEVDKMHLNNNKLKGSVSTEIGLLKLSDLRLSKNQLNSSLPSEIGLLSSLDFLVLHGNSLQGMIPSEIGSLSNAKEVYVDDNKLTGSIPSTIGSLSNLRYFYLYDNKLTGSIPSQIGLLSSARNLRFHSNSFSGTLPSEIGSLSSLYRLQLFSNSISGSIPSEIGTLSSLSYLFLFQNSITGRIPSELGTLSSIKRLSLEENELTGMLPSEIGLFSKARLLYFSKNKLSGSLPSEIGLLLKVQYLYLHTNEFTGRLPSEIGLLSNAKTLPFYSNKLTGSIPSEIGLLSSLQSLYLNDNKFAGSLPSEIGLLSEAQKPYFHKNALSGRLPSEIGLLSNAIFLPFYSNKLTGSIPSEIGLLSSLQYLYLNDNKFTGTLPAEVCELCGSNGLVVYYFNTNITKGTNCDCLALEYSNVALENSNELFWLE